MSLIVCADILLSFQSGFPCGGRAFPKYPAISRFARSLSTGLLLLMLWGVIPPRAIIGTIKELSLTSIYTYSMLTVKFYLLGGEK